MLNESDRDAETLTGSGQRAHYATDENLAKRQSIFRYVDPSASSGGQPLDRIPMRDGQRVVDVGCGNGMWLSRLLEGQRARWAAGLDSSRGMVESARRTAGPSTALLQADAHALPFLNGAVDGLLAMHMLYHVANLLGALGELRRVLARDGWLLVTTNSAAPSAADRLYRDSVASAAGRDLERIVPALSFNGENGEGDLRRVFGEVTPADHVLGLSVTEPEALFTGLDSVRDVVEATIGQPLNWAEVRTEVVARAEAIIEETGAFRYEHRTVSYICRF
jgi:SAM-dependent methyltransferase